MSETTGALNRASLVGTIESARLQAIAVIAATILIGTWHWQNDGLWFQGDAPRHAATGFFFAVVSRMFHSESK